MFKCYIKLICLQHKFCNYQQSLFFLASTVHKIWKFINLSTETFTDNITDSQQAVHIINQQYKKSYNRVVSGSIIRNMLYRVIFFCSDHKQKLHKDNNIRRVCKSACSTMKDTERIFINYCTRVPLKCVHTFKFELTSDLVKDTLYEEITCAYAHSSRLTLAMHSVINL